MNVQWSTKRGSQRKSPRPQRDLASESSSETDGQEFQLWFLPEDGHRVIASTPRFKLLCRCDVENSCLTDMISAKATDFEMHVQQQVNEFVSLDADAVRQTTYGRLRLRTPYLRSANLELVGVCQL